MSNHDKRKNSLADFVINASAKEKKSVYTKVLKQASDDQLRIISRANKKLLQQA